MHVCEGVWWWPVQGVLKWSVPLLKVLTNNGSISFKAIKRKQSVLFHSLNMYSWPSGEQCLVFPRASLISSCCKRPRKSRARPERAARLTQEQAHIHAQTRTCNHMSQRQAKLNSVLLSFSYLPGKIWDHPETEFVSSFSSVSVFSHKGVWTIHIWLTMCALYFTLHLIRHSNYILKKKAEKKNCQCSITYILINRFLTILFHFIKPGRSHWDALTSFSCKAWPR